MAIEELEQRRRKQKMEWTFRHEVEDLEKEFKGEAHRRMKDLEKMWTRRHDWERRNWETTMEQMKERENYITKEDDIWLNEEIANKLNADILVATKEMEMEIKGHHNNVQNKVTRLKMETVQADHDYNDAMDEIDKLKEKLRQ